jgi:hypothetical protein
MFLYGRAITNQLYCVGLFELLGSLGVPWLILGVISDTANTCKLVIVQA